MDVTVVARDDRLRDLLRFDVWDWLGELVGFALLGLVLADVVPLWVLFIVAALTLRPFFRWGFRVAGRLLVDE